MPTRSPGGRRFSADLGLALVFAVTIPAAVFTTAEIGVRIAGAAPEDAGPRPGEDGFAGLVSDPLLGPRPRPGYAGRWLKDFDVRIDDRGFRAAGPAATPQAEHRVAFLGDSCTFGWGLADEETFVAGLAERARRQGGPLDLLNAGFPGDSAVAGPIVLRERVLPRHPDVVVLGYSGNNAFRFSAVADVERYRFVSVRRLLFHSRLIQLLAQATTPPESPGVNSRAWEAFADRPVSRWRRVASVREFEAALRVMVPQARHRGAEVVFLLFPRASQVSLRFPYEDPGASLGSHPLPARTAPAGITRREANLLQYSCLDVGGSGDPVEALHARAGRWNAFYPRNRTAVETLLAAGARAYLRGGFGAAERRFREATARAPDSALALYDLASTQLARGRGEVGFRLLERAERASCNVFLRYQIAVWRVAVDLGVPVVDLMLHFQARDAGRLFLDPAHPSAEARDVIAAALWPVVREHLGSGRIEADAS